MRAPGAGRLCAAAPRRSTLASSSIIGSRRVGAAARGEQASPEGGRRGPGVRSRQAIAGRAPGSGEASAPPTHPHCKGALPDFGSILDPYWDDFDIKPNLNSVPLRP